MQKSSMLAFLSIIGIVGVGAFTLIMISVPKPGQIELGLQGYTNTFAVVGITNRSVYQFNYIVMVQRKLGGEWPKGLLPGIISTANQSGILGPGQITNLTLPVMVYAPPCPWRISVFCNGPPAQANALRFKAGLLAIRLGMRKLAKELLRANFKQIQVSTAEMPQWDK